MATTVVVVIAIIAVCVAIGAFARSSHRSTSIRTEGHIRGPGEYAFDIVGESKYQNHLELLAGTRTESSARIKIRAVLMLEDDNPYDINAVCITIQGLRVGYLDRAAAKAWRRQLKERHAPLGHYTADALIVGGWDRGADDLGHFGVRLDLPVKD